ncbi:MAG: crossover junction endodeoxyribonuclease RuvC [Anaerolineales bacterium]|nr:crossover junction endodeoxyribonuclease RuvC [Anaerolineales bacterium]MDW8160835.1 crossover junction endodeoxyribonuclease RuvC [Anaerolineales bacterium]
MVVIGLDPGLAITGYGIICQEESGQLSVIDCGAITTTGSKSGESERLLLIYRRIVELLALHQPEAGAVERLFFHKNSRSAMAVGQARGVILLALAQQAIPVYEYAPVEVKQALTGYGDSDKRQMQEMIRLRLGLDDLPRPDDVADALAVAICHFQSYRIRGLARRP